MFRDWTIDTCLLKPVMSRTVRTSWHGAQSLMSPPDRRATFTACMMIPRP